MSFPFILTLVISMFCVAECLLLLFPTHCMYARASEWLRDSIREASSKFKHNFINYTDE
jgi:hypothetical protein